MRNRRKLQRGLSGLANSWHANGLGCAIVSDAFDVPNVGKNRRRRCPILAPSKVTFFPYFST
jgi:hypothetical protein